jgi:hypothetical protein
MTKPDGSTERVPAPVLLVERAEQRGARGAWSLLRSLVKAAKAAEAERGVRNARNRRENDMAPPCEVRRMPRDFGGNGQSTCRKGRS